MSVTIISGKKVNPALTFDDFVQGNAYRNVNGDVVIATDEDSALIITSGYVAAEGHWDHDQWYAVELLVEVKDK